MPTSRMTREELIEEIERLHAIWQIGSDDAAADAANDIMEALPELLERVRRLEADLKVIASGWRYVANADNSLSHVDWTREQLIEYARAALEEIGQ